MSKFELSFKDHLDKIAGRKDFLDKERENKLVFDKSEELIAEDINAIITALNEATEKGNSITEFKLLEAYDFSEHQELFSNLMMALFKHKELITIELPGNHIDNFLESPEAATKLWDLENLKSLDLSNNKIGGLNKLDEQLIPALVANSFSLEKLDVSNNQLSGTAASNILACILHNFSKDRSFTKIDLSCNNLGEQKEIFAKTLNELIPNLMNIEGFQINYKKNGFNEADKELIKLTESRVADAYSEASAAGAEATTDETEDTGGGAAAIEESSLPPLGLVPEEES